ncbi:MAG: hypothetical protein J5379_08565 [Clostridiales bacterium]|nr:hypothetical protein [Clostridiales bacterium]
MIKEPGLVKKDRIKSRSFAGKYAIIIGAFLLIASVAVVTVSSFQSKKALENSIDHTLKRRAVKCKKINLLGISSDLYTIDDGAMTFPWLPREAEYVPYYASNYSNSLGTGESDDDEMFSVRYDIVFGVDEDGQTAITVLPVIHDQDGDWLGEVDDSIVLQPGGLFFAEMLEPDAMGNLEPTLHPVNFESGENPDLYNAGLLIIEKDQTSGWKGDYRFYCYQEVVMAKPTDEYLIAYKYIDTEEDSSDLQETIEENGFDSYTLHSVIFYDASSELSDWTNHVIWNALVSLLVYVLIMAVITLLLYRISRQAEDEDSGELLNAGRLSISEELAKDLLHRIDSAESSMGPCGYLDEIRSAVLEHVENSEETESSDDEEK